MKAWKKVLAVILVCLCAFAVMQVMASAVDEVQASEGIFSDSIGEFLIRLPVRIAHILFTIIKAPFVFIAGLFGR